MRIRTPEQKAAHAAHMNVRYHSDPKRFKAEAKAYYERTKEERKRAARAYHAAHRAEILFKAHETRKKFDLLKLDRPCYECGGMFPPCAMHWDHLPPFQKYFEIGECDRRPFDAVVDEIAKCQLVCANCHAVRTKIRRGVKR